MQRNLLEDEPPFSSQSRAGATVSSTSTVALSPASKNLPQVFDTKGASDIGSLPTPSSLDHRQREEKMSIATTTTGSETKRGVEEGVSYFDQILTGGPTLIGNYENQFGVTSSLRFGSTLSGYSDSGFYETSSPGSTNTHSLARSCTAGSSKEQNVRPVVRDMYSEYTAPAGQIVEVKLDGRNTFINLRSTADACIGTDDFYLPLEASILLPAKASVPMDVNRGNVLSEFPTPTTASFPFPAPSDQQTQTERKSLKVKRKITKRVPLFRPPHCRVMISAHKASPRAPGVINQLCDEHQVNLSTNVPAPTAVILVKSETAAEVAAAAVMGKELDTADLTSKDDTIIEEDKEVANELAAMQEPVSTNGSADLRQQPYPCLPTESIPLQSKKRSKDQDNKEVDMDLGTDQYNQQIKKKKKKTYKLFKKQKIKDNPQEKKYRNITDVQFHKNKASKEKVKQKNYKVEARGSHEKLLKVGVDIPEVDVCVMPVAEASGDVGKSDSKVGAKKVFKLSGMQLKKPGLKGKSKEPKEPKEPKESKKKLKKVKEPKKPKEPEVPKEPEAPMELRGELPSSVLEADLNAPSINVVVEAPLPSSPVSESKRLLPKFGKLGKIGKSAKVPHMAPCVNDDASKVDQTYQLPSATLEISQPHVNLNGEGEAELEVPQMVAELPNALLDMKLAEASVCVDSEIVPSVVGSASKAEVKDGELEVEARGSHEKLLKVGVDIPEVDVCVMPVAEASGDVGKSDSKVGAKKVFKLSGMQLKKPGLKGKSKEPKEPKEPKESKKKLKKVKEPKKPKEPEVPKEPEAPMELRGELPSSVLEADLNAPSINVVLDTTLPVFSNDMQPFVVDSTAFHSTDYHVFDQNLFQPYSANFESSLYPVLNNRFDPLVESKFISEIADPHSAEGEQVFLNGDQSKNNLVFSKPSESCGISISDLTSSEFERSSRGDSLLIFPRDFYAHSATSDFQHSPNVQFVERPLSKNHQKHNKLFGWFYSIRSHKKGRTSTASPSKGVEKGASTSLICEKHGQPTAMKDQNSDLLPDIVPIAQLSSHVSPTLEYSDIENKPATSKEADSLPIEVSRKPKRNKLGKLTEPNVPNQQSPEKVPEMLKTRLRKPYTPLPDDHLQRQTWHHPELRLTAINDSDLHTPPPLPRHLNDDISDWLSYAYRSHYMDTSSLKKPRPWSTLNFPSRNLHSQNDDYLFPCSITPSKLLSCQWNSDDEYDVPYIDSDILLLAKTERAFGEPRRLPTSDDTDLLCIAIAEEEKSEISSDEKWRWKWKWRKHRNVKPFHSK